MKKGFTPKSKDVSRSRLEDILQSKIRISCGIVRDPGLQDLVHISFTCPGQHPRQAGNNTPERSHPRRAQSAGADNSPNPRSVRSRRYDIRPCGTTISQERRRLRPIPTGFGSAKPRRPSSRFSQILPAAPDLSLRVAGAAFAKALFLIQALSAATHQIPRSGSEMQEFLWLSGLKSSPA